MLNDWKRVSRALFEGRDAARWLAAILLVFFISLVHGQAKPETQTSPAATVPTVSQNVDEVTLDIVVHDKRNKLILDLKPEDFVVSDNDTPVNLTGLHLVRGDAKADHLITFVFDRFEGAGAKNAQSIANKILKMVPAKGYSFAVLDFSGRLRLIEGFSEDRKTISQAVSVATENRVERLASTSTQAVNIAVDKAEPGRAKVAANAEKNLISIVRTGADLAGHHVDVKERARSQTLLTALQDSQKIIQDQHTRPSLAGLLALVRSQQKINERKSVIYFTQGSEADSGAKEMIKTISGAAARAGVSIYTVDMNALDVGGRHQLDNAMVNGGAPFNPAPQPVAGSGGMATTTPVQQQSGLGFSSNPLGSTADFMMRTEDGNPFSAVKSPMADLAKETGGIYIDGQDNVKKPLQHMVEDMTTYYQATYVPPIQEYDGTFRAIAVKPVRAGLNLKTKAGYFALAPGAEIGIRPFEVPLLKLFTQSVLPHDLKFHAAVLQFGELPDGNSSTVAIEVPIASLETKKDTHTNLFSVRMAIMAEIVDHNGTVVEHFGEDVATRGALESLDADPSACVTFQRHFMAIPGQYMLEAAAMDEIGGKISAQRIDFEISATQVTPSLSPIVLVKRVDSINDDNEDFLEPLRYEKGKITANLSGVVPGNAKGVSLFFILHPDPASKEPATLEMEASRVGHPGHRTLLPLRMNGDGAAIPYLANFKSGALAAGSYEVKAMLSQGGKTAAQQAFFTVEGSGNVTSDSGSANAPDTGGAAVAADAIPTSESSDSYSGGLLAITPVSDPLPPPAPEEIQKLIDDARVRAVGYAESLPNFLCVEVTNRSYDLNGSGNWKHRDTLAELLRYRDKTESHTMLEINGQPSTTDREALLNEKNSTLSGGELGGVLKAVFDPKARADFKWKETDALGSGTVQVFDYRVAKANSMFSVVGSNDFQLIVGFHGQVYIDSSARNVRRVTLEADDLPKDFPTHSTSMGVDYDYVAINGHDYLLPISAEVRVRQGRREAVMNTIEFRDYRRFGSAMKILGFTPVGEPK
jgi:VWFA-related protein